MPESAKFPSVFHNCIGTVEVLLCDSSLEREVRSSPTILEVPSIDTFQVAGCVATGASTYRRSCVNYFVYIQTVLLMALLFINRNTSCKREASVNITSSHAFCVFL
jgi:hypothetical protein